MMDIYKKAMDDNYVLQIIRDDDADSPRDWDNLGTMVCWHRDYNLGDKHNYSEPRDMLVDIIRDNNLYNEVTTKSKNDFRIVENKEYEDEYDIFYKDDIIGTEDTQKLAEEYLENYLENEFIDDDAEEQLLFDVVEEKLIILPLYLYDHSGITMSTGSFNDPWDSGQVGWIYCSKERFRKETGYTEDKLFNQGKAIEMLVGEVKNYDQYLTGDVYGYKLYKINKEELNQYLKDEDMDIEDLSDDELENFLDEINSCWGFYGDDFKENGILDQIGNEYKDLVEEL
jgi:hypothetical protein